jgi:hypothetical protein
MVRVRSAPGITCHRHKSPGGAKQHYGVWPARPSPGEHAAAILRLRPRILSVPHGVSSKRRARPPRGATAPSARPGGNRDPLQPGQSARGRVVPVSAWLAVRAAQAGDVFTHSQVLIGRRSAAWGPIQRQRGRALDAADQRGIGIGCPTPSRSVFAFALACPSSADSSPRRAGGRIKNLASIHGCSPLVAGPLSHQQRSIRHADLGPSFPPKRFWSCALRRSAALAPPQLLHSSSSPKVFASSPPIHNR